MCPARKFQTVHLPEEGELWITGDLHDHRRNFEKFLRAADLSEHPDRHVIFQEIIHGDYFDSLGSESSCLTLYQAAELKCDYPSQVHFLLANHDLAQIYGEGIMKAGLSVCEAFSAGVKKEFGGDADKVKIAIKEFLLSLPLAVRCSNGIFCCHSIPADQYIDAYDYTVFDRELKGPDYARKTGPVYQLIWGRHASAQTAQKFAAGVGARVVVCGHQPQEIGFGINGEHHLILASEHNQGVYLPINLAETYDMEKLVESLQRFAAVD